MEDLDIDIWVFELMKRERERERDETEEDWYWYPNVLGAFNRERGRNSRKVVEKTNGRV